MLYPHRASSAAIASTSIGIHCDARVTLGNGSGTNFQESQCVPMYVEAATIADADADAAADAQFAYTVKVHSHYAVFLHNLCQTQRMGSIPILCV